MRKTVLFANGSKPGLLAYAQNNQLEIIKEFSNLKQMTSAISLGEFDGSFLLLESLSNLAISVQGFARNIEILHAHNIKIIVPGQATIPSGSLLLWAQFFAQLDSYSRTAGAKAGWARGRTSNPTSRTPELVAEIKALLAQNVGMDQIASDLKISRSTAYRWLTEGAE